LIISIKKYRKHLTIEDLIFLHLLINNNQDKYIVTEMITEKGIQRELNCAIGFISRILTKNEEDGFIYRKLMKIEKIKRKRHAFYLTNEGLERAEELRKKISDWE
jgi:DNA-binding PadR family transcriptional regulator